MKIRFTVSKSLNTAIFLHEHLISDVKIYENNNVYEMPCASHCKMARSEFMHCVNEFVQMAVFAGARLNAAVFAKDKMGPPELWRLESSIC